MNFYFRESDHEGLADSFQFNRKRNRTEDIAFSSKLALKDLVSASDAFKSQENRAEFNDGI